MFLNRTRLNQPRVFAGLFVFFLFFLHFYAVVFQVEIWPISHYPMFARPLKQEDVRSLRFHVHDRDGVKRILHLPKGKARNIFYWRYISNGELDRLEKRIRADFEFHVNEIRVEVIEIGLDSRLYERELGIVHAFEI